MVEALIERDVALGALRRSLARAEERDGSAVFFLGEAGLGKTSVLKAARELAGVQFTIGSATGERMEETIPFGLASRLLDSLAEPTPRLLPTSGAAAALEPSVPLLRIHDWLEGRDGGPLLLLLDDLQWADPDSVALLGFLVRRLARLPVALIGSFRPWPAHMHDVARGLEHFGAAETIRLEELGPESAAELLERRSGERVGPRTRERAWQLGRGNPLLIDQLGRLISMGESVPDVGGELTDGAEHLLLSRFAGLDDAAMRLARCGCVIGVRFRSEIALASASLADEEQEGALEALARSGLVVDTEDGWSRFVHPLFAQALYDDMSAPVRRLLHRRTFELLAARGLASEAADHAIRGDLLGVPEAARVLEEVGRTARSAGAPVAAARALGAAVRFRGHPCPPELLLLHAEALIATAQIEPARETLDRLLAGPDLDRRDRVEALRLRGQAGYMAGAPDRGDENMREAVRVAREADPATAVRPLLDHSSIAWMVHGPKAALELAVESDALARETGSALAEVAAARAGYLRAAAGDPAGIAAVEPIGARLATGDADDLLDPAMLLWPPAAVYSFAHAIKYAGRFEQALEAFHVAAEALERVGAADAVATVALFAGNQLARQGFPNEALVEAARAERISDLTPMARPFAALLRAEALLLLGRTEESEALRTAANALPSFSGSWLPSFWSRLLQGIEFLWRGEAAASRVFLGLERTAAKVGLVEPSDQPWAGYAVQAHLVAGEVEDAERVTRTLEALQPAGPMQEGMAMLSRARVEEARGRRDDAEEAFAAAVERLGLPELPLAEAEANLAFGAFLRRNGRTGAARERLRVANRTAERVGLAHLGQAAAAELRLAGGRRSRGPEDRDRLTAAELRVAREVAEGYTNAEVARRLYLSTNTVQTHLKRVYAKLEIGSRRELASIDLDLVEAEPSS